MLHHKHKNVLTTSLRAAFALGSLVAFSGTAAHAGLSPFDFSNGPGNSIPGAVTAVPYEAGDGHGNLPSPYSRPVGTNTAKFTATGESSGATSFESFRNQVSTTTNYSFDFPLNTQLLDTFDPKSTNGADGPLQISFANPVGSFVIQAQEAAYAKTDTLDIEQFFVYVYDTNNTLITSGTPCTDTSNANTPCSFQTGPVDNHNTAAKPNGQSVFLGAGSSLSNISRVVINDFSTNSNTTIQNYHGNSNDVYYGPLTVGDPVPEASTMTGFGLGSLFFSGLFLVSRKRKSMLTSEGSI